MTGILSLYILARINILYIYITMFNRFGEAGLKGSGGGGGGMGDIFNMFFDGHGGGGGGQRRPQQKKAPVIREFLDVELEDLYYGRLMEMKYERMQICSACNGVGGAKVETCPTCNGTGRVTVVQRMGYMTMQTQRECQTCGGTGEIIIDKCKVCNGRKVVKQKKKIEFKIPVGSKHGTKHILRSQGHEMPNAANGDLVIVFRCKEHKIFKRIGADLAMEYNLTLKEAICGYDFKIKHVSGKILRIKSKKGEITPHEQLKAIYNWGMPQKGNTSLKGHLYVKFKIAFPKTGDITDEQIEILKKILPKSAQEQMNDKIDEKMAELEARYDENMKKRALKAKQQQNNGNNNNSDNKMDMDDDMDEKDREYERLQEIHEEAEDLGDEQPKVTPHSAKSAYDEDQEQQHGGTQCRQM